MKRHLIIALLVCVAGILNARAEEVETNSAPMFGIKAAFDVNIPGDWHIDSGSVEMYRQGKGFTLGGVYNVYLGKGFYVEPGVSFFYDAYSYLDLKISDKEIETPSLYKTGLRIPVVVGYSFNLSESFSMRVYTGPELSWAMGGKIKVKNSDLVGDFPDSLFGNSQRRVDCAWKIGVGVPYNGFLISVDGAIGVTDLMKNPDLSFRENRVTIGLTYYL
ncbi:MAG: PorT family protein [Paramuribaculum sp.]|nr:PorT family protein [Paramuribaculum sp.]